MFRRDPQRGLRRPPGRGRAGVGRGSWSGPHCWAPGRTMRTRRTVRRGRHACWPVRSRPRRSARGCRRWPGWRRSSGRCARAVWPFGDAARSSKRSCSAGAANRDGRQAEQADTAGRGRPWSSKASGRATIAVGRVDRARPTVAARVIVANPPSRTLSVNVRAAGAGRPQSAGDGVGQADSSRCDVGEVVEVVGERLLVADRLDVAVRFDRPRRRGRRRGRRGAGRGPGRARRSTAGGSSAARSPTVRDAHPLEPCERRRPDAPQPPHRQRVEVGQLLAGRTSNTPSPGRTPSGVAAAWPRPTPAWRGTCSGATPTEHVRPSSSLDAVGAAGGRSSPVAEQRAGAGDVEERLVEGERLDERGDRCEDLVDLARSPRAYGA